MFELLITIDDTIAEEKAASIRAQLDQLLASTGLDVVESVICLADDDDGDLASMTEQSLVKSARSIFHSDRSVLEDHALTIRKIFPTNLLTATIRDLGPISWTHAWNESVSSFTVGRYRVILDGLEPQQGSDQAQIRILLESQRRSFGSGQHATTRACLSALDDLVTRNGVGSLCLDIGTGNGVLAIAAALTGWQSVLATDIDEEALNDAANHAALNKTQIIFQLSDEVPRQISDLVMANILGPELMRLIPDLAKQVAPEGRMIIAGFIRTDDNDFISCAEKHGLVHERSFYENDWSCLVFKK